MKALHPSDKNFMAVVNHRRNEFIEIAHRMGIGHTVYPSKHFFERVVERGLEALDVAFMLVPVIKEFKGTTYNLRTFCVLWKQYKLVAMITTGVVSGQRRIVLKTVFEKDVNEADFDVVVTV